MKIVVAVSQIEPQLLVGTSPQLPLLNVPAQNMKDMVAQLPNAIVDACAQEGKVVAVKSLGGFVYEVLDVP